MQCECSKYGRHWLTEHVPLQLILGNLFSAECRSNNEIRRWAFHDLALSRDSPRLEIGSLAIRTNGSIVRVKSENSNSLLLCIESKRTTNRASASEQHWTNEWSLPSDLLQSASEERWEKLISSIESERNVALPSERQWFWKSSSIPLLPLTEKEIVGQQMSASTFRWDETRWEHFSFRVWNR